MQEKHLASGLQSDCAANLTGAQYKITSGVLLFGNIHFTISLKKKACLMYGMALARERGLRAATEAVRCK